MIVLFIKTVDSMGVAPKKNLYKELSLEIGVMDERSAMHYYYGFVRYIISELKKDNEVQLPELGKIFLRERKDKMLHNVNTGQRELMEGGYSVVFKPSRKLKSYFKAYGKGKK